MKITHLAKKKKKKKKSPEYDKSPTEEGFIDECIGKNKDKDDPGAYCASIVDRAKGTTDWRKGPRKSSGDNWYKKARWVKESQESRWFEWDDNMGGTWVIDYKNINPQELYDDSGRAFSDKDIMKNMIVSIQNKWGDRKLTPQQIEYWFDKFGLTTEEFFEGVQEANKLFRDEQRIEERDIEMGLNDR